MTLGPNRLGALAEHGQPDMFPEAKLHPKEQPDDRYTARETLAWCMRMAGVEKFDLDVAACAESHKAGRWYGLDRGEDGLLLPWSGNVWCNPPFSDLGPWVEKAWDEMRSDAQLVAMLLPSNRTEQPFWQKHIEPFRDGRGAYFLNQGFDLKTHFVPSRVSFGFPGNPEGLGVGSPPFACVLLVWRRRP